MVCDFTLLELSIYSSRHQSHDVLKARSCPSFLFEGADELPTGAPYVRTIIDWGAEYFMISNWSYLVCSSSLTLTIWTHVLESWTQIKVHPDQLAGSKTTSTTMHDNHKDLYRHAHLGCLFLVLFCCWTVVSLSLWIKAFPIRRELEA